MSEEEAREKADKGAREMVDSVNRIAEMCAEKFEKWALEHKSSTREEAHKKLVGLIESGLVTSNLIFGSIMTRQ